MPRPRWQGTTEGGAEARQDERAAAAWFRRCPSRQRPLLDRKLFLGRRRCAGNRRHRVWLAGLGIMRFGRVLAHDPVIVLAPLALELLELSFADHVLDAGGEV